MDDHALRQAIHRCRVEDVRDILNSVDDYAQQELDYALGSAVRCEVGAPGIIELLLAHGAGMNAISYSDLAHNHGSEIVAIFQKFLDFGWDINSTDTEGQIGLRVAVRSEECVKWFLDHGADPSKRSLDGVPTIVVVARSQHADPEEACKVIKLLASRGEEVDLYLLYYAVCSKHGGTSVMKCLLDLGVDVNATLGYRDPLLYTAITDNDKEKVRVLLDYGAHCNIVYQGMSHLEYATDLEDRPEICEMLRQAEEEFFAQFDD